MPQLAQLDVTFLSQWFWLLIVLAAIFFVVGRGIVPKVEATVDERDAKIAADLAEAAKLQDEAEAAEDAWRTKMNDARADAQAVTNDAKAKAAADVEKRVGKADAEIAEKTAAAEAELAKQRESALAELETVAAEAAQGIVAKLTGASVSDAEAKTAVAGAMSRA